MNAAAVRFRIVRTHRKHPGRVPVKSVKITPSEKFIAYGDRKIHLDSVRVTYCDGDVREFERLREEA